MYNFYNLFQLLHFIIQYYINLIQIKVYFHI